MKPIISFAVIPSVSTREAVASLHLTPVSTFHIVPLLGVVLFILVLLLSIVIILVLRHILVRQRQRLQQRPVSPPPVSDIQLPVLGQTFSIDDFPHDDIAEKYLKDEEKIVYKILKSREGRCEQGTLQVIMGFSKASLSRLLEEMETRGIIEKIKKGKKNLVHLKI